MNSNDGFWLDRVYFQTMARDLQLGGPRLQGSLVHANSIQLNTNYIDLGVTEDGREQLISTDSKLSQFKTSKSKEQI